MGFDFFGLIVAFLQLERVPFWFGYSVFDHSILGFDITIHCFNRMILLPSTKVYY